jgi:hypothetical protein
MRHSPINSPSRTSSTSERTADSHRAGIRSLDCGHDDAEDGTLKLRRSAESASRDRAQLDAGSASLGEQQQSV